MKQEKNDLVTKTINHLAIVEDLLIDIMETYSTDDKMSSMHPKMGLLNVLKKVKDIKKSMINFKK